MFCTCNKKTVRLIMDEFKLVPQCMNILHVPVHYRMSIQVSIVSQVRVGFSAISYVRRYITLIVIFETAFGGYFNLQLLLVVRVIFVLEMHGIMVFEGSSIRNMITH